MSVSIWARWCRCRRAVIGDEVSGAGCSRVPEICRGGRPRERRRRGGSTWRRWLPAGPSGARRRPPGPACGLR
ncbi:hypothetical protein HBB16_17435 [Pseudonocardia sp. MCCB 268]|nr:hypothetical protein [Pseudonocardia cytotoxica]